jgi:hypothetical protein
MKHAFRTGFRVSQRLAPHTVMTVLPWVLRSPTYRSASGVSLRGEGSVDDRGELAGVDEILQHH